MIYQCLENKSLSFLPLTIFLPDEAAKGSHKTQQKAVMVVFLKNS